MNKSIFKLNSTIIHFLIPIFLFSCLVPSPLLARTEYDERWVRAQQETIRAKESRVEEIHHHSEMIQRQITEERKYIQDSHERIWQEYMRSLELERTTIQEKLDVLDERRTVFERELEKKRAQDEVRMKEKEREIQRLLSEMERLRAELKIDRVGLEARVKELSEQEMQEAKARASQDEKLDEDHELLEQNAVKIGKVKGGDILENRPFKMRSTQNEYYIEIGDVLDIEVWRVPDMTRSVTVRPDGRISMPLVGDLHVVGVSLTELREIIQQRITEYVIEPQVSISIRQFGGRKFIILGEVRLPGVYRYEHDISLLEAIALAGSFTKQAKKGQVMIIRGDIRKQPKVKIIKANMQNVLKKGLLTENLMIRRNDIIYVGRDFLGDYNNIISEVINPGVNTTIDFFVLRDAIRRVQNRPR